MIDKGNEIHKNLNDYKIIDEKIKKLKKERKKLKHKLLSKLGISKKRILEIVDNAGIYNNEGKLTNEYKE